MTSYFGHDPDTIEASVYQVFVAESDVPAIDPFIRPTEFEGLALLPASTALATVERKLIGKDGMGWRFTECFSVMGAVIGTYCSIAHRYSGS